MAGVLALLNYVVSVLLSLVGITQSRADQITVNKILAILTDPVVGLNALHGELTTVLADLASIQGDVLALGSPQQAASPVTLPTPPPPGYGALDAAATGDAVWTYATGNSDFPETIDGLYRAANLAVNLSGTVGLVTPSSMSVRLVGPFGSHTPATAPGFFDAVDPSTIQAGDATVLAWLQREYNPAWTQLFGQPYPHRLDSTGNYVGYVTISQPEFEILRAMNAGELLPRPAPPIWPGLANVTYGADQSMDAPTGSLTGPADGYKIVIDSAPSWAGTYSFGARTAYRNVGAIAFVDDEGVPEFAQTLGLDDVIYLPRTMNHSVGAYYRLNIGYHCVATPFVINS